MTYGILIYEYAKDYPNLFDSIDISASFYPNSIIGFNVGKNGTTTPNWGVGNVVPFLLCKDSNWTQEHTDAINDSIDLWNTINPTNQLDIAKSIFDETEKQEMIDMLRNRQIEIASSFTE